MTVDGYLERMFGTETIDKFKIAKILLVGAGGIGCELLKDLIMMNIGEIHVLDLDTIDLSNLNRQFLFRQKDIKKSKSMTAINAVEYFNHKSKLFAYHGNIMDTSQFPLDFFSKFTLIYNALDNLEARLYVNKMALFTKTPLFESGTTGLQGQVQPIYPGLTECFHCLPKQPPKTFPVCTIRSTPSKPIHSITWAKNFLLPQLFGEKDPDNSINPDDYETKEEADAKMKEANELNDLKELILKTNLNNIEFIKTIIVKIYIDDIQRLLRIDALWKDRKPPLPLSIDSIPKFESIYQLDQFNLSDQLVGSLDDMIRLFYKSTLTLTKRLQSGEVIEFDKDDQDTLQFVVAASNLRSYLFNIELHTEFKIKQIAGNIIPAVATTNAIMAGFSALTSIQFFLHEKNDIRVSNSKMVYDSSAFDKVINSTSLTHPNKSCKSCSIIKGVLKIKMNEMTISDLRNALIEKYDYSDDVEIMKEGKLLYDFDLEENLNKKINEMVKEGEIITVADSDEKLDLVELYVMASDDLHLPDLKIPEKLSSIFSQEEYDDETNNEDLLETVGDENNGIICLDDDEGTSIDNQKGDTFKRKFEDDEVDGDLKRQKVSTGEIEIID
ncbi:E1 ubiquitin-activating protein [Martiniozyma asiatica (nom. inval.)]|nr:E1 ubiquitin-activating protein [Martiniozyma asiatica]